MVMWSIKDTKTQLVIDRQPTVYLKNVELKVSQVGRLRVLKERRKNVHAGVKGIQIKSPPKGVKWLKAYYNPYKTDSFVLEDTGLPIYTAKYVRLDQRGLYVGR